MNLESYRRPRLVIQNPKTSVYEAVRAMESNHIGYVIVQDRHEIVGVLTDRDVALRVIGNHLDPDATPLRDVMTNQPVTLPVQASEEEALSLMRDRHIRRVPVLDSGEAVGLVTLDDLILSKHVDQDALAEIILAQLSEPAEHKPEGSVHPTSPPQRSGQSAKRSARRSARARQTTLDAARRIQSRAGLETPERALQALEVLLGGLVRRITPAEATDLISQLPSELQDPLLDLRAGPDTKVTRQSIARELAAAFGLDVARADALACAVGAAVTELVSEGELRDVRSQLPEELRAVLAPTPEQPPEV